ncbi:MAG TPA: pyridoxamine 5'-phosphate oxidase family protein [Bryobacteraceae bacterium]
MTNHMEGKAKIEDMLKSFSTAMFVTVGPDGKQEARPMHVAGEEPGGGEIWFLTGKKGSLTADVSAKPDVLLVFQKDTSAYLSLRGTARVVEDRAKIRQLWKEPYKVWFPQGAEDPGIALVAVHPVGAEYWDNRGANKLEYMFEAAKAYMKGTTPTVGDADQHGKTAL